MNDFLIVIPFLLTRLLGDKVRLLEQIEKRVCRSNEVRVIRIDQGCLDLDQVENHFISWIQTVVEDTFHDIVHFRLQLVVALKFRELNFKNQPSELLIDQVSTVKRRLQQPGNLLADEDFEGALRHEQTWAHGGCILDRRLNVLFAQVLKRINSIDNVPENLMEDEVDTSTSQAFRGDVPHEPPLELIGVLFEEFADEVEDDRPHTILVHRQMLRVVCQ